LEQLVVSGCNASELLEVVEEALDTVALLVEIGVVGSLDFTVALGRNDDLGAAFGDLFGKMVGIVSLVGNGRIGVDTVDQVMGKGDAVALSGRGDQADRQAECLGGGVDLGAQATARPAQALGMSPPLTLRAPAAC
jgi:hypothetical protein